MLRFIEREANGLREMVTIMHTDPCLVSWLQVAVRSMANTWPDLHLPSPGLKLAGSTR